jgi:CRP-like cAMP-binding protein
MEPFTVPLTERLLHLRAIPVAAMLKPEVLHMIARYLEPRTFARGDHLTDHGTPLRSMHLLLEGKLALLRDGKQVGELAAPQTIGFLGILARAEAPYDAVALEATRSLELSADALYELLEDHFSLFDASLRYLSERLVQELVELPEAKLHIAPAPDAGPIAGRAMDYVERIVFVRGLRAFASANINALAVMTERMVEERHEAGVQLWSEGDPSNHIQMLVAGTLRCRTKSGKTFDYGRGAVVGGTEGIARMPRWYSLETASPVVLLRGRQEVLMDLLEENFPMAMDFVAFMAGFLQSLVDQRLKAGAAGSFQIQRDVSKLGKVKVGA